MPEWQLTKQALRHMRQIFFTLTVMLILATAVAACGKKPSEVDPPPGADPGAFSRTYPDPATDPK